MKYTAEEIAQIISETISESAKDIVNLEDRRPLVSLAAKTMFKILEELSGVSDEDTQVGRDIKVLAMSNLCIEKLRGENEF
jgi:hypothetical protein